MHKLTGLVYVTLFSLTWAIQTLIYKIAVNKGIEPLAFSYQTLLGAAFILFIYIVSTDAKGLTNIRTRSLPKLAAVGILGSGVGTLLSFYGLKYSTSINFGFLIKSTVIFSVLLAFLFLREKITLEKVGLMILLLVGAYLISTKGQTLYPRPSDGIILAAAFFISCANVMARPLLYEYPAEVVTFLEVLSFD